MYELKAPSFMTLAGEGLTPFELTRLVAASPSLAREARGSGEPVLVLPGLGASNSSTVLLRSYLSWLGYNVQGWTLGRNRGNVREMLPWVVDQIRSLHARTGSKVHAVGWSLGGRRLSQHGKAPQSTCLSPQSIRNGTVLSAGRPVLTGTPVTLST